MERENISIQVEAWKKYQPSWASGTDVTWREQKWLDESPQGMKWQSWEKLKNWEMPRKLQRSWKKRLGCTSVRSLESCTEFRPRWWGIPEDNLSVQQGVSLGAAPSSETKVQRSRGLGEAGGAFEDSSYPFAVDHGRKRSMWQAMKVPTERTGRSTRGGVFWGVCSRAICGVWPCTGKGED